MTGQNHRIGAGTPSHSMPCQRTMPAASGCRPSGQPPWRTMCAPGLPVSGQSPVVPWRHRPHMTWRARDASRVSVARTVSGVVPTQPHIYFTLSIRSASSSRRADWRASRIGSCAGVSSPLRP
jgi:hypothetical protein